MRRTLVILVLFSMFSGCEKQRPYTKHELEEMELHRDDDDGRYDQRSTF